MQIFPSSTLRPTLPIIEVLPLVCLVSDKQILNRNPGRTRLDRLHLIGSSSLSLYSEALKLAIAEAKTGQDVGRYEAVTSRLHEIAPDDRDGIPDLDWVDKMTKKVKADTDRLESELKGYKNNLIKESIRVRYS